MSKVLLIIAQNGFQPIEYGIPKKILNDAGIEVVTASLHAGKAIGSDNTSTNVDLALDDIRIVNYDGIYLIGGSGALADLDTEKVYAIMQEAQQQNKNYGSICISTRILAKAGTLINKKATGHNGDGALLNMLVDNGAIFVDQSVVEDENVITATGPSAAEEFGKSIANALV